jgi:hypothetical protein
MSGTQATQAPPRTRGGPKAAGKRKVGARRTPPVLPQSGAMPEGQAKPAPKNRVVTYFEQTGLWPAAEQNALLALCIARSPQSAAMILKAA